MHGQQNIKIYNKSVLKPCTIGFHNDGYAIEGYSEYKVSIFFECLLGGDYWIAKPYI